LTDGLTYLVRLSFRDGQIDRTSDFVEVRILIWLRDFDVGIGSMLDCTFLYFQAFRMHLLSSKVIKLKIKSAWTLMITWF